MQHSLIFIRDILANFSIPNSSQSPDIVQNSDSAYVQFWTSGQSFINKSCHHSRASHDIDMKLEPATKLERWQKNTATSKNFDHDVMISKMTSRFMANLQPFRGWFPDAWATKLVFSLTVTFYFTKTENRIKKYLTQLSYCCFK